MTTTANLIDAIKTDDLTSLFQCVGRVDINEAKDVDGTPAIVLAVIKRNPFAIALLLGANASPNVLKKMSDGSDMTALDCALQQSDDLGTKIAKMIIKKGGKTADQLRADEFSIGDADVVEDIGAGVGGSRESERSSDSAASGDGDGEDAMALTEELSDLERRLKFAQEALKVKKLSGKDKQKLMGQIARIESTILTLKMSVGLSGIAGGGTAADGVGTHQGWMTDAESGGAGASSDGTMLDQTKKR